ncbi:PQQ-dependent sugar dehydrogenase [uncultured Cohaesibacter sp.]|uniref:PQQ-dependent sugar dehydrogenase n=1 Tax=uncultured Cohaesibacter sp. TaxID=1002546 RepID=UPI0029C79045|nr:PQQ-dependent sugar dehydrogenase [uncultured Cohaesibacter sp.]
MNATFHAGLLAVGLIAGSTSAYAQSFNDREPNAPDQQPAFDGQTRAPLLADGVTLKREVIANRLDHPWGMDQLPDGRWIVTERSGSMRIIARDGTKSARIDGLPEVDARGQGGLLDVAIRDDFAETRRVWWSFSEPRGNGTNATAVATGILSEDESRIENAEVIFQQNPAWRSTYHFGSRLIFDREGALFVTTGERSYEEPRQLAQDVSTTLGKVVRINPMGGPAEGNPSIEGGLPEIWSYGHRNLQSAALDADGKLWTVEHGPKGGDELNQPKAGRNYGWPVIAYGVNYSGTPVGQGITARDGMEQPVYYWDPVIAPSGMVFYEGELFPEWRGDVLIGGLASRALVRLKLDGERVVGEARYIEGSGRIRDVDVDATDGSIIVLTDAGNGALVRLTPQ